MVEQEEVWKERDMERRKDKEDVWIGSERPGKIGGTRGGLEGERHGKKKRYRGCLDMFLSIKNNNKKKSFP